MSTWLLGTLQFQVIRDGLYADPELCRYVGNGDLNTQEKIMKFVRGLAALNSAAYNYANEATSRAPAVVGAVVYKPTRMQLYKALTCVMYQCNHDEVLPKFPKVVQTYKALMLDLGYHMLSITSEWNNAQWDIMDKSRIPKLPVNTNPRTVRLKSILKTAKRF